MKRSNEKQSRLAQAFERRPYKVFFAREFGGRDQFTTLLNEWMTQEGCTGKPEQFLKKTGLTHLLTLQEFEALWDGRKVPSERLSLLLSTHLPGALIFHIKTERVVPGLGKYHFLYLAEQARENNPELPELDIREELFTSHCTRILQGFAKTAVARLVADKEENKKTSEAARKDIHKALAAICLKQDLPLDELLERMDAHYEQDPLRTLQLMRDLLNAEHVAVSEMELAAFFTDNHTGPAASALRFIRRTRFGARHELLAHSDTPLASLTGWENDKKPRAPQLFVNTLASLDLPPDELAALLTACRPELVVPMGTLWLADKILAGEWQTIAFPALDTAWLDAQPEKKRPGLLLRDLRLMAGMTQKELGKATGLPYTAIQRYESATRGIPTQKLGDLLAALNAPAEKSAELARRINPELTTHVDDTWLSKQIAQGNWQQLSYPVLDDRWFNAQPEKNRAGLLLNYFRLRANFTLKETAEKLGINNCTLLDYETARCRIDLRLMEQLKPLLCLTTEETGRLITLVQPDITHRVGIAWVQQKIENGQWHAIHYPAQDPDWLDQQEPQARSALLLRSHMSENGITIKPMRAAHSVGKNIDDWLAARTAIPASSIQLLSGLIRLDPAQTKRFAEVAQQSAESFKGTPIVFGTSTVQAGGRHLLPELSLGHKR